MIRYYHSVGRVPLAIRFAYGFPRLYQFVYPIPVRSVSALLGQKAHVAPRPAHVPLYRPRDHFLQDPRSCWSMAEIHWERWASWGKRTWTPCPTHPRKIYRSPHARSLFDRDPFLCAGRRVCPSLLSFWDQSTVGPTVSGLPGLEFLHLHPTRGEEHPQHTIDSKSHAQSQSNRKVFYMTTALRNRSTKRIYNAIKSNNDLQEMCKILKSM